MDLYMLEMLKEDKHPFYIVNNTSVQYLYINKTIVNKKQHICQYYEFHNYRIRNPTSDFCIKISNMEIMKKIYPNYLWK